MLEFVVDSVYRLYLNENFLNGNVYKDSIVELVVVFVFGVIFLVIMKRFFFGWFVFFFLIVRWYSLYFWDNWLEIRL